MAVTVRWVSDWLKLLFIVGLLATAGVGVLVAQSQSEATPQQTNQKIQELAALARTSTEDPPLGPGDLVHIDVFDIPELSRDLRVSDAGVISFPLLQEPVHVGGLTPFQLERKLEQLLSAEGLVAHPQVSVFVKEQASQPVTIVGAVGHPAVAQISRPMSLLELLANAGGITDEAGSEIMVTRTVPPSERLENVSDKPGAVDSNDPAANSTTIKIELKDLLDSGNPDYNIQVHGGDVVNVPRAGIIYVLGFGIAQQGEYVLQAHGDQVTALKAVALAHGLSTFAKADNSVIMRNDPATGKRIEIPVHLKQIQNHKIDDVPLRSNDILYVPDSRSKKALARGTETVIGVGTGLAIYRVE
jgi:polysaccharide biosynthesis/export protein